MALPSPGRRRSCSGLGPRRQVEQGGSGQAGGWLVYPVGRWL